MDTSLDHVTLEHGGFTVSARSGGDDRATEGDGVELDELNDIAEPVTTSFSGPCFEPFSWPSLELRQQLHNTPEKLPAQRMHKMDAVGSVVGPMPPSRKQK